VRKTYVQAYFNMGGGYADLLVAWPTAEMSFMDPRQELLAQWELDTLPYGAAARHLIDEVIDTADTRDVVIRFLAQARTRSAIGQHRLDGWPTKF